VRRLISAMVSDVLAESGRQLRAFKPASVEEIRHLRTPMVTFSAQMAEKNRVLQAFLSHRMYRHERVLAIMERAQRVIRDLFDAYMNKPELMPPDWREDSFTDDRSGFARQVCDFIAGMTDRYALDQHKQLFDLDPLFR
jgi:dGTPase